ncbi:MAG: DUF1573 domain-containing protein [Thermoanaerobaculia bacterium]
MSSDDFGTVNLRRGEIDLLRQELRQQREQLAKLTGDVDRALARLDALEGPAAAAQRPLVAHPAAAMDESFEPEPRSRIGLIIAAAVIALAVIAGLVWWASSDRMKPAAETPIVEEPVTTAPVETAATQPPPSPTPLAVTPPSHDYGTIRKGTRATRQYELANNSDEPMTVQVARSACRCLFYEHAPVIPPKGKENLTVTIDGARAKAGELRETIQVSAKSNPAMKASFDVIATIR